MANCSTCGNSSTLPCGCSQSSLTTSCYPDHYNCGALASQSAEAYCMECVQPCTKEDAWSIETNTGIVFTAGKNDSLTKMFQQFMLSQTTDANTFNTNLIPLFYISKVTQASAIFHWEYVGTANITGFQIRVRAYDDNNWSPINYVNNPSATSMTVGYTSNNLTSGIKYVFQINTLENGVATNAIQSVDIILTIP